MLVQELMTSYSQVSALWDKSEWWTPNMNQAHSHVLHCLLYDPKNFGSWSDPILLAGERRAAVPKITEGCRAAIFARSAWIWHLSRPPSYFLLIGQWIWQNFKYAFSPYASSPSDCSLKSNGKYLEVEQSRKRRHSLQQRCTVVSFVGRREDSWG